MPLPGTAALAMWWNIASEHRIEFEDWHSHEHFPERLRIPGFHRASRWTEADGGEGIFVLYELASFATLSSAPYLDRLNAPSPWSQRMMPLHRDMVRCQCHVLESAGGTVARHALTVRLSPAPDRAHDFRAHLHDLVIELASRPGLTGAHLLRHETPDVAPTTEQRIRNLSDRTADMVVLACAYDRSALEAISTQELGCAALQDAGSLAGESRAFHALSHSAVPSDMS